MSIEPKELHYDHTGKEGAPRRPSFHDHIHGDPLHTTESIVRADVNELHRGLSGFHTSMIAIGGAIGAGLFVSAGGAFENGGPASVLIGFAIIGAMMFFVMQALGEMAVLYPQNGAFTAYIIRFVDPSWGFAMGMIYAISWLTVLPFELTAASLTIDFWDTKTNVGVWITVFLVALVIVQFFGVRAYGWTEVFLSLIKVTALVGFCLFAIIDNAGGVSSDPRGYIGFEYWKHGLAFQNGFHGFCAVFVTAAFAFGGTELVGLTAAENKNPAKQLPKAIRQTLWRIALFYLLSLFLVGLLVPATNPDLLDASSSNTKDSIFVIALKLAGVKGLPSVFNVVITLSVLSVANSCTYGSTRTFQAMAGFGMLPRFLAYVDTKGRPIPTILLQIAFAMLAFINEAAAGATVFNWLLALTAIAYFFVWGSICLAHIRFRMAWKKNGRSLDELQYRAAFGSIGSYIGLALNWICLIASVYVGVAPLGGGGSVEYWFEQCLAIPCIIFFYIVWKVWSFFARPEHRRLWVNIDSINIYDGMRDTQMDISGPHVTEEQRKQSIADIHDDRQLSMMQRLKVILTSCF